jgi:hypothetical protein
MRTAQLPVALQLRLACPLTPEARPAISVLLAQLASPAHEQDVSEHVRLLCPGVKEQPVAAHCTCTRGLATTNPMPQLALAALHCTNRLPGSSRPLSRSPGGRSQAYDLSWKPGAKASELLQVAAALPVLAAQASAVWQRAQPGPVKPAGQVAAWRRRVRQQDQEDGRQSRLAGPTCGKRQVS